MIVWNILHHSDTQNRTDLASYSQFQSGSQPFFKLWNCIVSHYDMSPASESRQHSEMFVLGRLRSYKRTSLELLPHTCKMTCPKCICPLEQESTSLTTVSECVIDIAKVWIYTGNIAPPVQLASLPLSFGLLVSGYLLVCPLTWH